MALFFDVTFADAGLLPGTSGLKLGDLCVCGLTLRRFNGMTVRDFFLTVNGHLGGTPFTESIDDIAILTNDITAAFQGGAPSAFAQTHLFSTPCP